MGTVISNLKARFGVDTSDFKKGLKDGEKATEDFKGAAGGILEEFATMFGVNMSGVTSALGTANKSLSFLGQSFKGAAAGGEILSIAMKVLKFALMATGIGALVVILGSVIAYFTKSGEGADKFARILAQLKSVLNNVVDRLVAFGKGVVDFVSGKFAKGIEEMGSAFKGMGTEIKEDFKAAGALADAEEALEDREIALITSLEERRAKAAELRRQAKEEMDDQRKKLALLAEAEKITKSVYSDQVSLEKERLRIMREKLAIQTSDPTDEQNREIAKQEAEINSLLREQSTELRGMLRERNSATKALEKELAFFGSIKNIKIPDVLLPYRKSMEATKEAMDKLRPTYIALGEQMSATFQVLGKVSIDAAGAINSAFEGMASGMGEFLGALMSGDAGIKGFGKMIAATFADLAITVGKIAIGAGFAVMGIKQALMTLNPWVAIAAGIALVALGSAIRGSLTAAASGGGGGGSSSLSGAGSAGVYDTRTTQPIKVQITGKLYGEGKALVAIIDQEYVRKNIST